MARIGAARGARLVDRQPAWYPSKRARRPPTRQPWKGQRRERADGAVVAAPGSGPRRCEEERRRSASCRPTKAVAEAYVPRPGFVSQLTALSYKVRRRGHLPGSWSDRWRIRGRRQGTARLGPDVPAKVQRCGGAFTRFTLVSRAFGPGSEGRGSACPSKLRGISRTAPHGSLLSEVERRALKA